MEMSNLYAAQKGTTLNLTEEELLTFYGILLTTGYNTVPRRRLLWSDDDDLSNMSIRKAMRRNRFDEIMASIHVVDNMNITADPFFKILFEELNKVNKTVPILEHLSVDEMVIEYFGRHGCKQFIRRKPIRFGYKIWSLASSTGFVYQMEPYVGSHTRLVETGLGQGPSVVLGLAEKAGVPPGCKFYHNNLFTTLSLVDEMTKRGYGSCGTMRENRLFAVPLTPAKMFRKASRGDAEYLVEEEKLIVRWNDNSAVTVVSNMEKEYSDVETQRWNKQKNAMDRVKQPTCIKDYNTHMGGVDLHDQCVNRYRISIRSKKWWWPCYSWALNSALVNSWCYYRYMKLCAIEGCDSVERGLMGQCVLTLCTIA